MVGVHTGTPLQWRVFSSFFHIIVSLHLFSWWRQEAIIVTRDWAVVDFDYDDTILENVLPLVHSIPPTLWQKLLLPLSVLSALVLAMPPASPLLPRLFLHRSVVRCAGVFLAISYSCLFFTSKTMYVNHHWLYMWMLWICVALEQYKPFNSGVFRESLFLCAPRALLALMYFWAGVAKSNTDWMFRSEPISTWFFVASPSFQKTLVGTAPLGPHAFVDAVVLLAPVLSWCSLLLDFLGGPLLFLLATRSTAPLLRNVILILLAAFHVLNAYLFDIGTFPLCMLASSVLWLSEGEVSSWRWAGCWLGSGREERVQLQKPHAKTRTQRQKKLTSSNNHVYQRQTPPVTSSLMALVLLVIFILFHAALPLLPYVRYNDSVGDMNPAWQGGDANLFAWRMMLTHEYVLVRWLAHADGAQEQQYHYHTRMPGLRLSRFQSDQMRRSPQMITDFARKYVSTHAAGRTATTARTATTIPPASATVSVDSWKSLNGRWFQRWLDPLVDLAHIPVTPDRLVLPLFTPSDDARLLVLLDENEGMLHQRGFSSVFHFCDRPHAAVHWEAEFFEPFADELTLGVVVGEVGVEMDGANGNAIELPYPPLRRGFETSVPWNAWHRVVNVAGMDLGGADATIAAQDGRQPDRLELETGIACFYYAWKDLEWNTDPVTFAQSLRMA